MVSAPLPPMCPFFLFEFLRGAAPRARKASQHGTPHPHASPRRAGPLVGSPRRSASGASLPLLLRCPPRGRGAAAAATQAKEADTVAICLWSAAATAESVRGHQRSARVRIPCENDGNRSRFNGFHIMLHDVITAFVTLGRVVSRAYRTAAELSSTGSSVVGRPGNKRCHCRRWTIG